MRYLGFKRANAWPSDFTTPSEAGEMFSAAIGTRSFACDAKTVITGRSPCRPETIVETSASADL
jgi:hypothetical protein